METQNDSGPEEQNRIVYVRPVATDDLPDDVRQKVGENAKIFAVHNAEGQRLALVRNRQLAFVLARQNDLAPVNVH